MKFIKTIFVFILLSNFVYGQRIKDIAYFKGINSEQLIGYGLVVGLSGTGDSYRSTFTVQSVTSMLKRFGITVPETNLRTRNVAAVMVTAKVSNLSKEGSEFDVAVSSLGDAKSLMGGNLLMTPLSKDNGEVMAMCQGAVSIGGYDINTSSGGRIAKNHALSGRIPNGGVLEKSILSEGFIPEELSLVLKDPDFTTASAISDSINSSFGENIATLVDGAEIALELPAGEGSLTKFLADVESIQVVKDVMARVVLNERTGTVVSGSNVQIAPVSISHGSLNITIKSFPIISQPSPFSQGETTVFNNQVPDVQEDDELVSTYSIEGASNAQEVAAALNSLKVSPRDIIAIFQALKEAGALTAELVIM